MPTFETTPSTRRSTRAKPAAISSTAPWRSSIRPWSETAKSTRSDLPPPSSTACAARTARSSRNAHAASATATTAAAAAPIAIQPAVSADMSTELTLTQGEDDRELGGVVLQPRLARHGQDVHLHGHALREDRKST